MNDDFDWSGYGQSYAEPGAATPYACYWDTAGVSIAVTTAGTAPCRLPRALTDGVHHLNICLGVLADNKAITAQLLLADADVLDQDENPSIIRVVKLAPTQWTPGRRTDGDGADGYYFTTDVIADIQGCGSGKSLGGGWMHDRRWFLGMTSVDQSTVRLYGVAGF